MLQRKELVMERQLRRKESETIIREEGKGCPRGGTYRGREVCWKGRQLSPHSLPTFLFWCFLFHWSLPLNYHLLLYFALHHHFLWDNNFLLGDLLHCPGFNLLYIVCRNIASFLRCQTSEEKIMKL